MISDLITALRLLSALSAGKSIEDPRFQLLLRDIHARHELHTLRYLDVAAYKEVIQNLYQKVAAGDDNQDKSNLLGSMLMILNTLKEAVGADEKTRKKVPRLRRHATVFQSSKGYLF